MRSEGKETVGTSLRGKELEEASLPLRKRRGSPARSWRVRDKMSACDWGSNK